MQPRTPLRPAGNGSLLPDHQLAEHAYAEAALTHYDRLAGDIAAAVVRLCRALIHGTPWLTALQIASAGRAPATIAALGTAGDSLRFRDGFAPHVLHAAIHFVDRADQLAPALDAALAFAGPANYCPVLVGAIGGTRWGAAQIESNMLAHCQLVPHIHETADRLAQPWPE